MKQMKKGFTLIELMIVVAIIGVLAAVAIPKFADLIRKAQEAACKGQLGALRSALSIYYGTEEGVWPTNVSSALTPTYIQAIPNAKPGTGLDDNAVTNESGTGNDLTIAGTAGWWYNANQSGTYAGCIKVNTTATDTKLGAIHDW